MRLAAVLLLAALPLAACSTVKEAAVGPSLSPSAYPVTPQERRPDLGMLPSQAEASPASANSLWRSGARAFFIDQRASRVGDIVTVQIAINDSAKTSNTSVSNRSSETDAALTSLFGLEGQVRRLLPPGNSFNNASPLQTNSTFSSSGSGSVNRAEAISLTVAAVVTGILPNGNLIIEGTQEVRTNAELRQLTVSGMIRPEDISSTNTIRHTQIAEARISYGGRGDISTMQKAPAGQSVVARLWPF
ncbi:MAG: flagellar basal body L-ring protein FlgH [Phenylobacterium sp.]